MTHMHLRFPPERLCRANERDVPPPWRFDAERLDEEDVHQPTNCKERDRALTVALPRRGCAKRSHLSAARSSGLRGSERRPGSTSTPSR